MLSINTNLSSLIAQQSMTSATNKLNQAIERMTTGYKINGAKDNAANYSIATNMTTKINSYMVAEDNVAMSLDMLSTANGSLDQISDKLTRLRALATQASNGTYGAQSLTAINSEANALVDEINRIYSTAEYNGRKLFTGAETNVEPAAATFGMARAASTNTTYTDEEVAAMTSISDVSSFTSGECYSISTAEELARLAELTNSGVSTYGATFVLANDIDLKEWCEAHAADGGWIPIGSNSNRFYGSFDGNGHVISNLTINRPTEDYQGLFGNIGDDMDPATIKNLGIENVNIKGGNYTGGLVGYAAVIIGNCYVTGFAEGTDNVGGLVGYFCDSDITNSYSTGAVSGTNSVGGLVGVSDNSSVTNCYATGTVDSNNCVGGLVGYFVNSGITNSYSTGAVSGTNSVGGLVGYFHDADVTNSYATGTVSGNSDLGGFIGLVSGGGNSFSGNASVQADSDATQMTAEEIAATYTPESMGFTEANGWRMFNGQPIMSWQPDPIVPSLGGSNYVTLQVGINADSHSQIGLEFGFALDGIESLRQIGLDTSTDYLSTLDNMLDVVSAKATEYGAAQNRLESALDEIAIQYDNLVSSRSTLRDADIAEVSSQYIQQQILQQASATLLATANQSPSIALQLI